MNRQRWAGPILAGLIGLSVGVFAAALGWPLIASLSMSVALVFTAALAGWWSEWWDAR